VGLFRRLTSEFPPMKIGGPIEALQNAAISAASFSFPPMKIGGPIEADPNNLTYHAEDEFPPMKIGGPIEAFSPYGIPSPTTPNFRR